MRSVAEWLDTVFGHITSNEPWQAGLIGLLLGYLICPGYMYFPMAIVAELRWPKYRDQFKAFMPGNLFLGGVFGSACYLYASHQQSRAAAYETAIDQESVRVHSYVEGVEFFDSSWWYWAPLVTGTILVMVLSAIDIAGAITYKTGDKHKYHWRQLFAPTKVWHNVFVYGIYGYLLVKAGVPGLFFAPWASLSNTLVRLLLLGCLSRWMYYLWKDVKEPKHQTGHVIVSWPQVITGYALMITTLALAVEFTPMLARL